MYSLQQYHPIVTIQQTVHAHISQRSMLFVVRYQHIKEHIHHNFIDNLTIGFVLKSPRMHIGKYLLQQK